MTLASEIRTFIVDNFLFGDTTQPLEDDASLIEAGLVDSTGILELVSHVEATYGLAIKDAEIVPDNFDSINRIAAFIGARSSAPQAA